MTPEQRNSARKHLDDQLAPWAGLNRQRPPKGWIRAIREALGMTTYQLAARLNIKQPSVHSLERSEKQRTISLESLERAAAALNCELVYALVPRKKLKDQVEDRVRDLARQRLVRTRHSMQLENQAVNADNEADHLERLIQEIHRKPGSTLWEDAM
ncbi:MAG: mobile mystery protein A [Gammaproteobacteria bacterium]